MKRSSFLLFIVSSLLFAASFEAVGQEPTPEPNQSGARIAGGSSDPQPYEKVITKDAKTRRGIFDVHRVKDKYFYEIPKEQLNKEFLLVSQIAKTTVGQGYGGQALAKRVVRWERSENKVFLRNINYDLVAGPTNTIAEAVRNANNDTILMAFPIAAFGPNDSVVIDVSRLFTADIFELSAKDTLKANTLDAARTYLERISPYPENIEVEVTHTYTRNPTPNPPASGMRPGSATVVLHHSMVKLPEKPMMPRLFDERVGYFSVANFDFGRPEQRAVRRRFITRWRLEKKDPNAALSEPVKPIVYYVDRATPAWLVPYVKLGIEKWQKAFEAAGFKNAIVAKMPPTVQEDPEWSPEDARYSVVRWLPSNIENASGPHISDPRTGEILESDIQMYHNVMKLVRDWYFVQVAPLDARVQKLPISNELMGKLVEYVVAHEVGHTLGFQHNMKASSMYPQEKVRDREWVKRMGHTPTLMDYSRFNYVAQPDDEIDVADLIPGIGPYDTWATAWGYKPIANADSPDAERATLDEWAREQDKTPWLRFSTAGSGGSDFGELTEAVGDADAVRSTALGIENLKRVAKLLVPATTTQKGEPYNDLTELYGAMLGQWTLELNHVAAIVGAYASQQKHIGQSGVRFTLIPKSRQSDAVRFLNRNAFATPTWAIDKEILRRIEPVGGIGRIRNAQSAVLSNLLSSPRFARLTEQQALDGDAAYGPADFLADVRKGVWAELDSSDPVIDAYRRNLQRSYLHLAAQKVANTSPAAGDERASYLEEISALESAISAKLSAVTDQATNIHLKDVLRRIEDMRDPKEGGGSSRMGGSDIHVFLAQSDSDACWMDHAIRP